MSKNEASAFLTVQATSAIINGAQQHDFEWGDLAVLIENVVTSVVAISAVIFSHPDRREEFIAGFVDALAPRVKERALMAVRDNSKPTN